MSDHLNEARDGDHLVELYESETFLVESVRDYLTTALVAGDHAVVVATREHRELFSAALTAAGVDVLSAERTGRYVALDAAETLSTFMVEGKPDPRLFRDAVGALVERASRGRRRVRVYGEMVAILWAGGNAEAAI